MKLVIFFSFTVYLHSPKSVFSKRKSLRVLQKARIKIVARAIYIHLFFSYTYTLLCCCKIKSSYAGLHKLRARLRPWRYRVRKLRYAYTKVRAWYWFLYVKIIWICQFVCLFFFCPVLGWFYHVVLPVRAINCENCQLSTGAINL